MANGYWIAHVDVDDPEVYSTYVAANAAPIAEYGGRFLVRAGEHGVPATSGPLPAITRMGIRRRKPFESRCPMVTR